MALFRKHSLAGVLIFPIVTTCLTATAVVSLLFGARSSAPVLLALIVFSTSLAVAISAAISLYRAISRPILDLAETAKRVGRRGDCKIHVEPPSNSAIGCLYAEFNVMLERLQASQHELQKGEAALAEAERIGRFGNWQWDLATGEVTWSDEVYRIFGLDREHFEPGIDSIVAMFPPEDQQRGSQLIEQATRRREPGSFEQRICRPDGVNCVVDSSFEGRYDEQGNLIGMVGVVQDVTERKEAEDALRAAQAELLAREQQEKELVEAELVRARAELVRKTRLATLGQLTATVSHEIRNPLGSIRTAIYAIAQEVQSRTPVLDRALNRAERNIIRCDEIIEELLDYTRTKETLPTKTDVDAWLRGVLDEMEIPEEVAVMRELTSGATISTDREQLRRCVVNLVTNACQAMAEKPRGEARLTVETAIEGPQLLIRVRDTGCGIEGKEIDKIFEPLYTTKGFGVGLGLPMVEQLMRQLGGRIIMQSEPGRGTTATLSLPRPQNGESPNGKQTSSDCG